VARYDLHAHTDASDGALSPEQLVDLAVERDLQILAVADHDTTDGVLPCKEAAEGHALEVWEAIELSAEDSAAETHILGYFVDPQNHHLQDTLVSLQASRLDRGSRMVDRLNTLGMNVSWTRVQEIAGEGSVGRPHIASAMLENGYVRSIKQAFDDFIGNGGPAYVDRDRVTPAESIALIKQAGGFASLAHPQYLLSDAKDDRDPFDIEGYVATLVSLGLEGIEVYYPEISEQLQRRFMELARRHDLIETGGTDFHGLPGQDRKPGDTWVPEETISRMREWRASSNHH
jgi:predicted metal-dependent phosphoesterase TrpH